MNIWIWFYSWNYSPFKVKVEFSGKFKMWHYFFVSMLDGRTDKKVAYVCTRKVLSRHLLCSGQPWICWGWPRCPGSPAWTSQVLALELSTTRLLGSVPLLLGLKSICNYCSVRKIIESTCVFCFLNTLQASRPNLVSLFVFLQCWRANSGLCTG